MKPWAAVAGGCLVGVILCAVVSPALLQLYLWRQGLRLTSVFATPPIQTWSCEATDLEGRVVAFEGDASRGIAHVFVFPFCRPSIRLVDLLCWPKL